MSEGPLLFANGVDATTGGPLLAPMTVESLARLATSAPADQAGAELAARHRRAIEQVYALTWRKPAGGSSSPRTPIPAL